MDIKDNIGRDIGNGGFIILVYTQLLLLQNKYDGFLIFMPGSGDASPHSADQ